MKTISVILMFLASSALAYEPNTISETEQMIRRQQYESCIASCPTWTTHCSIRSNSDETRECKEEVSTDYNFCVRQCRDRFN